MLIDSGYASLRLSSYSFFRSLSHSLSSRQNPDMVSLDTPRPHRAFIALGSNIGDRIGMVEKACSEMERSNIKIKRTSSLFETAPMYVLDQDFFLNGVCEVGFLSLPE